MANTKQAKKRIAQNNKKQFRNKSIVSRHRTELKKFVDMLSASAKAKDSIDIQSDTFKSQLRLVVKLTDSAVNKGVYHRNKAARIKSRLFTRIHTYTEHAAALTQVSAQEATAPEGITSSLSDADVDTVDNTQS